MGDLWFIASGSCYNFARDEVGLLALVNWSNKNTEVIEQMPDGMWDDCIRWYDSLSKEIRAKTESDPIQDFITRRIEKRKRADGEQSIRDAVDFFGQDLLAEAEDKRGEGLERSDPWVNRQSHRMGYHA